MKITSLLIRRCDKRLLADIREFFRQASRVSFVGFDYSFNGRKSSLTAKEICSMVPINIKHLAASIKNVSEMKNILQKLPYLSSANFMYQRTPKQTEIAEWLNIYRPYSSYKEDTITFWIWLGKDTNQLNEIQIGNKRMKLNDPFH